MRRFIIIAVIYLLAAAAIWFGLGSLWHMSLYRRLATEGVQVNGTVEETLCHSHNDIRYSFHTANGRKIVNIGGTGKGNPDCQQLRKGDQVIVWYLPSDPDRNTSDDPAYLLHDTKVSVAMAACIFPSIFVVFFIIPLFRKKDSYYDCESPIQRTLSSKMTIFFKFILPTIWIAGFGAGVAGMWLGAFRGPNNVLPPLWFRLQFLCLWLFLSIFIIWLARRFHRVTLQNGMLTISNYFREISVPVANITRVTQSYLWNPQMITIHLDSKSAFGQRIVFVPAGLFPRYFSEHPTKTLLKNIVARMHKGNHTNAS